jgi:hypothetical protein
MQRSRLCCPRDTRRGSARFRESMNRAHQRSVPVLCVPATWCPFPYWPFRKACCICPRIFRNSAKLMICLGLADAKRICAEYLSRLSRGMATVRPEPGRPDIAEPSSTSVDFQRASPFFSFLTERLSRPPSCWRMSSGGKTAWIACRAPRATHSCSCRSRLGPLGRKFHCSSRLRIRGREQRCHRFRSTEMIRWSRTGPRTRAWKGVYRH